MPISHFEGHKRCQDWHGSNSFSFMYVLNRTKKEKIWQAAAVYLPSKKLPIMENS